MSYSATVNLRAGRKSPSLAAKVTSLGRAVGVVMTRRGPILVPPAVLESRLTTCKQCPDGHWNPKAFVGTGGCTLCGCCMFKPYLAGMSCPKQHWNSHNG